MDRYVITVHVFGATPRPEPKRLGAVDAESIAGAIARFAAVVAVPAGCIQAGRIEWSRAEMLGEAPGLAERAEGVWAYPAAELQVMWFCWFGEEIDG